MTYRFSVNNVVVGSGSSGAGADIAMYDFKQFMKTASPTGPGWSVTSSGDGVSNYSSTGDVITGSGTGANNIGNTNAWFVLTSPDGTRQFLWQRGSANSQWLVLYSKGALFTGGTFSSRAAASDAGVVLGTTSNPTTTAATTHFSTTTAIWHFGGDDVDGYSFYYAGYHQTTLSTAAGGLVFDEIVPFDSSIDNDHHLIYLAAGNSSNNWTFQGFAEGQLSGSGRSMGWLYAGTAVEAFSLIPATMYRGASNVLIVPGFITQNLYTLADLALPIFYIHRNGPVFTNTFDLVGFKGVGVHLMWKGNSFATADTMSISSTRDRLIIGDCVLPFDGSVPST